MAYNLVHSEQNYMPIDGQSKIMRCQRLVKPMALERNNKMKKLSLRERNLQRLSELEKEYRRKKESLERLEQQAKARNFVKQEKRRIHNMIVFSENVSKSFRDILGYKFFDGTENDIKDMERAYKFLDEAMHKHKKSMDE